MFQVILLAIQLASAAQSYDEAKALADANEASLPSETMSELMQAQGNFLRAALPQCARPGMDLSKFTVVFVLNADGSVAKTWRQGETPLARCVHALLPAATFKGTWKAPFYTSIELTLSES
ncbi:hypothetical protein [Arenimonas terrae]|uniref:TonB C-terminal domain-containing protein n=1 Tax=Arenimonas terrae TaxID=2546226 RepID=A0A5C4RVF5_9GAMM|nr:hypothetical protein [Arenimonas terrae]TNJ35236.1 hypothetical protein E1B00_05625 [Arenimonas terrae]